VRSATDAPLPGEPIDGHESIRPQWVPPIRVGWPEDNSWVRLADLADVNTGLLSSALATLGRELGYPSGRVQGAGFVVLTSDAIAGILHRAVARAPIPSLKPERTWWQLTPRATVKCVIAEERRFFAGESRELTRSMHEQLDGIFQAVRLETGFPVRSQWALLVSSVAGMLKAFHADDHESAVALMDCVCASDALFETVRPRLTSVDLGGRRMAAYTRRVCCLNYQGFSGEYCSTCPLIPFEQRVEKLVASYGD
jgi:hypothetical protein